MVLRRIDVVFVLHSTSKDHKALLEIPNYAALIEFIDLMDDKFQRLDDWSWSTIKFQNSNRTITFWRSQSIKMLSYFLNTL